MNQRRKVVPFAKGLVLEIGIGSGLNLSFYNASTVEYIWGLEPCTQMLKMAGKRVLDSQFEVDFVDASAEEIPLDSNSVDTVLVTFTLCTIPDVLQALSEMRRVLRPGCDLVFCEHGLAPDEHVRRWQRRMNPIWKRLGGGCNLNRPIPNLIEQGGFKIKNIETGYVNGWKPASFNYWGTAVLV